MKFESKYDFQKRFKVLDEQSKKRLIEIKFFLTFKPLYDLIEKHSFHLGKQYAADVVELVSLICGVKTFSMIYTANLMTSRNIRPTKREIILALRFFGFSYKEIQKEFGISHVTIMKYVSRYFDDDNESFYPALKSDGIHDSLEEALIPVQSFFMPMGRICNIMYKSSKVGGR